MGQYDPWETGSRVRLRNDFLDGLRCYEQRDLEGALELFRAADELAEIDDIYQNRYTSFHGLVRVLLGDENGVKLCRKAAVAEQEDVEVYCNLAQAEYQLGYRGGAYMALRRGLALDRRHPDLQRLRRQLTRRAAKPVIPWLGRDNPVNRVLGKLLRRQPPSHSKG